MLQVGLQNFLQISRLSDKILEELKNERYNAVLVAKHNVTKSQELLFGDTSINLIRNSLVPVLVAKGLLVEF
jgi:nucleotide-binding universal stress UspA family protein